MKIILFYFSGTGNTLWLSQTLSDLFNQKGASARAISIEGLSVGDADNIIAQSDIVGFGYPIYSSDLPHTMKTFMESLSAVNAQPAFIYCTQWRWSADGAYAGSLFIKNIGFNVLWTEHFLMPNNISLSLLPVPFTNDTNKLRPILLRAKTRSERFVANILEGRSSLRGFNSLSAALGSILRTPYRKAFAKLRNDMHPDPTTCTRCGLCCRICPSGNFVMDELGGITTKGSCIICLRCYNFCPVSALTYKNRRHNKKRGTPYRGPTGRWENGAK